jgi:TonB family protein
MIVRCAAVAAAGGALLAALLASAAAPAAPPAATAPASDSSAPAPKKPSPAAGALQALLRELQRPGDRKLPATVRMERIAARQPSGATAERLRASFGTERLYTLERQPPQPGRVDWRLAIPALHYAPETDKDKGTGTAFDWTEGRLDFRFNQAGTTAEVRGAMDAFSAQDAATRFTARGITLASDQQRGADALWYGKARFAAAGLEVLAREQDVAVALSGMSVDVGVTDKRKTADIGYDLRVGRIAVAGEQVDALRVAVRLANLDKASLLALGDAEARDPAGFETLTPEQQAAALKPLLRGLGQAVLARGTTVEIEEISAVYHGAKAVIKGRVALQGARPADLDDPKALLRKLVARFDVRIPVALLREVAGSVAAKQAAQQGKPSDPQAVAQLRQSMTDVMVGKLLGGGFARLDDDMLVSTVEWRNGELRANGKPVPLPQPSPTPAPVAATVRGADVLQARRLDGSCTMPDYPEQVVRQDLALDAVFGFVVTADGKVAAPTVARPSPFPDYDRSVLAALAACRYAPALRGGKPFDLATTWRLVRVPGSQRP